MSAVPKYSLFQTEFSGTFQKGDFIPALSRAVVQGKGDISGVKLSMWITPSSVLIPHFSETT